MSKSQRAEAAVTPDRVHKKIVDIMQLTWASESENAPADCVYLDREGELTEEQFRLKEAEHASPLIQQYAASGIPRDTLFRVDEQGDIERYPLDYPVYQSASA